MIYDSNIVLSPSVVIWVGSLCIGLLGSIGSFCAHILLRMDKTLTDMNKTAAVEKVETGTRLAILERHDRRNQQENGLLLQFLQKEAGRPINGERERNRDIAGNS